MTASVSSWTQPTTCRICGAPVEHHQRIREGSAAWSPARHVAPCGAACAGGPLPRATAPTLPGVSGIAHVHREASCGTPGCGGGKARAIVEGVVAEVLAAAEAAKRGAP
jgi:hypothetical protein